MARSSKLSVKRVEAALRKTGGLKTAAAGILGVSRVTLYRFIEKNPEINEVLTDIKEATLDLAESKVMQGIHLGDKTYVIFYLKHMGRHRGWIEHRYIEGEMTNHVAPVENMDITINYHGKDVPLDTETDAEC